MSGPYEFGDVVDGYRWTVLGWEPVEGSEPAASAALQHAMDTRLARPAVTHHVRHTSTAVHASPAAEREDPQAREVEVETPPVSYADVSSADTDTYASADTYADAGTEPDPHAAADAPDPEPTDVAPPREPQRRWTPVGWEIVEPAEPVEEFADVVAAAPSGPPLEAEIDSDIGTELDIDPESDIDASTDEETGDEQTADAETGTDVEGVAADEDGTVDLVESTATTDDDTVLDLREPVAARQVTLAEPPAGWYPG